MSGFSDTLFSLLLGWTQQLIKSIWNVLNNESGSLLLHFVIQNWFAIVCIVCIAGVVMDGMIYFFRWRPDWVWKNRAIAPNHRQLVYEAPVEPVQEPYVDTAVQDEYQETTRLIPEEPVIAQTNAYMPPPVVTMEVTQAIPSLEAYQRPPSAQMEPVPSVVAPPPIVPMESTMHPSIDMASLNMLFDDSNGYTQKYTQKVEPADWLDEMGTQPLMDSFADTDLTFGMPLTQEAVYIPQVEPEVQLPPQRIKTSELYEAQLPVETEHPGLDQGLLRATLGFEAQQEPPQAQWQWNEPSMGMSNDFGFEPIEEARFEENKPVNPLIKMAQKACDFVGLDDAKAPPTLRDMGQMMDVPKAFHDPVYPQSYPKEGGEA